MLAFESPTVHSIWPELLKRLVEGRPLVIPGGEIHERCNVVTVITDPAQSLTAIGHLTTDDAAADEHALELMDLTIHRVTEHQKRRSS